MRKSFAFILILLSITICCITVCAAEPSFSVSAFDEYCSKWNNYYSVVNPRLNGAYFLSDDQQDIGVCYITYNENHLRVNYSSDILPPTASVGFMFNSQTFEFQVVIIDNGLTSNLEKVTLVGNNESKEYMTTIYHEEYNAWAIHMWLSEMFDFYYLPQFRAVMTVDGREYSIDISEKATPYLYDMFDWLVNGYAYAAYDSSEFGNKSYLPPQSTGTSSAQNTDYSFSSDISGMNKAANSVFFVEVFDSNLNLLGNASGFVAFNEHLFVTNQHVIDGASYLRITDDTSDENSYIIYQVIASDKDRDIAILLFPDGSKYDALPLNTDESFQRGEPIVAIGSPEGLKNSLSKGDISAIRQEYGYKLIQFSASISHGSSGGALFDDSGRVIGITKGAIEDGQNLNFAVSIKAVQELYDQWNGRSYEILGSAVSWDLAGSSSGSTSKATAIPRITPAPTSAPDLYQDVTAKNLASNYHQYKNQFINLTTPMTLANYSIEGKDFLIVGYADNTFIKFIFRNYQSSETGIKTIQSIINMNPFLISGKVLPRSDYYWDPGKQRNYSIMVIEVETVTLQ